MDKVYCIKCGKELVEVTLDEGVFPSCLHCQIKYTIHGTGCDGSLFVVGAEVLTVKF